MQATDLRKVSNTQAPDHISFSPDGQRLCMDPQWSVCVFPWKNLSLPPVTHHPFDGHELTKSLLTPIKGWTSGISFSHDGRFVAISYKTGVVEIMDADLRIPVGSAIRQESAFTSVSFCPVSHQLATTDVAGNVKIWRVHPSQAVPIINDADFMNVGNLAVSSRGIVSIDRGWVNELDPMTGERTARYGTGYQFDTWTDTGASMAIMGGDALITELWDLDSQTLLTSWDFHCSRAMFSADGNLAVMSAPDARLLDLTSPDIVPIQLERSGSYSLSTVHSGHLFNYSWNGRDTSSMRLEKWAPQNLEESLVSIPLSSYVTALESNPSTDSLFLAHDDGTIFRCDPISLQLEKIPLQRRVPIVRFAVSENGQLLAVTSSDGSGDVRVWDAATGIPVGRTLRLGNMLGDVEFDPGGRFFAATNRTNLDGFVRIVVQSTNDAITDTPQQVLNWVEMLTAMEVTADGDVVPLSNDQWLDKRNTLAAR